MFFQYQSEPKYVWNKNLWKTITTYFISEQFMGVLGHYKHSNKDTS